MDLRRLVTGGVCSSLCFFRLNHPIIDIAASSFVLIVGAAARPCSGSTVSQVFVGLPLQNVHDQLWRPDPTTAISTYTLPHPSLIDHPLSSKFTRNTTRLEYAINITSPSCRRAGLSPQMAHAHFLARIALFTSCSKKASPATPGKKMRNPMTQLRLLYRRVYSDVKTCARSFGRC